MTFKAPRKLTLSDLAPFEDAVAGHEGVLQIPDHSLIVKPCTAQEIAFYEESTRRHSELKTVMPLFYGTLNLAPSDVQEVVKRQGLENVKIEANGAGLLPASTPMAAAIPKGKMITTGQAVVLENLCAAFERPNIMDIKLGVRLWADDAPPEKRRKLDAVSADTTSGSMALRVAGMKIFQPKLVDTSEEYKHYDKMYGRTFTEHTIRKPFEEFFYEEVEDGKRVLTPARRKVVEQLAIDVRRIEKLLYKEETRMYSTSLLLIIEGDPEALERAKQMELAAREKSFGQEQEGEFILQPDDDGEDEDEEVEFLTCSASLIDFAHAAFTDDQGPDENTIRGIRNVRYVLNSILTSP